MLLGIKGGEAVDAQQRREKQRLQAVQERRVAMMQQRKVLVRMRVFLRLYRLPELGHNWLKGLVLVEPMGQEMHADTRQTGCNLDKMTLRFSFFFERSLDAVALCLD